MKFMLCLLAISFAYLATTEALCASNLVAAQLCVCVSINQQCRCDIKVPADICIDPKDPVKTCDAPNTILDLFDLSCISVAKCSANSPILTGSLLGGLINVGGQQGLLGGVVGGVGGLLGGTGGGLLGGLLGRR